MKLILTRILPLIAVLVVVKVTVFKTGPVPERPIGEQASNPVKPVKTREVSSANVAAIATRAVSRAKRTSDTESKTDPAAEMQKQRHELWSEFLKRHANGDVSVSSELLATIPPNVPPNLEALRNAQSAERRRIYNTLGKVGGGSLVQKLLASSDRHAALAVGGWAQSDPQGAMDWLRQLNLKDDSQMQDYLKKSNQIAESFLDEVSGEVLDSLLPAPENGEDAAAHEKYANEALQLVESLTGDDPQKNQAMMREMTERLLGLYNPTELMDWVNEINDPGVQAAAVQRMIEQGMFKDAPTDAIDWAFAIEEQQPRETAISAAFGRLGGGDDGTDRASIVDVLNGMSVGREKDFAINGFVHGLVWSDPERALEWASSISDKGFRGVVVENLNRQIAGMASEKQP
ncbi:MAG: hypothetical protein CMO80_08300 [Verrucomicrobiales bacterium]|nr:hypothetical protein [Verrucomicrobiales bacterium]|tara:strand:- start:3923 stop:5131 length:1209 start_codon:yes stop_codon:yes gene_type:complete